VVCGVEWTVQRRIAMGMGMLPAEPAIQVLDNAPTRGDLAALQFRAGENIALVPLPPPLTHVVQPIDVY
jgi:hypothetical protein